MYVVAPAQPAPYKWLNVPLRALTSERWPGYLPSWTQSSMDSYYIMLPSEFREAIMRHPALKNSQWTMALLATATVVTSAMVLYYYANYNGYETNISQFISFLNAQEFGWASFSSSMFHQDDSEDESYDDDDEHVDADLMDGYETSMQSGSLNVRLVSTDPTSELSHTPFHLDLCQGKTSRVPSLHSSRSASPDESQEMTSARSSILRRDSQVFPSQLLCDPRALYERPRHRRRMARHLIHDPWESLSPLPVALKDHLVEKEIGNGVDADKLLEALKQETNRASYCKALSRKVAFKEPDWAPYVETHGRARQRAVVAILARNLMSPSPGSSVPTSPAEEFGKDIFMQTLPAVPAEELNDGTAFWFERFTRATAAGGKHWDFRFRKNEPAEHFNSDIFDELLKHENKRMEEPNLSPSLSYSPLNSSFASAITTSFDPGALRLERSTSTPECWSPGSVLSKRKLDHI